MFLPLDAFSSPAPEWMWWETWNPEESSCSWNIDEATFSTSWFRFYRTIVSILGILSWILPIFIRTLLLHLDGLVQLAVRGAKVVIPLHVGSVRYSPLSVVSASDARRLLRSARSASVWSGAAFPRCHFNCGAGQEGRGSGPPAANQRATKGLSDSAVGPSSSCGLALTKSERRGEVKTSHSVGLLRAGGELEEGSCQLLLLLLLLLG